MINQDLKIILGGVVNPSFKNAMNYAEKRLEGLKILIESINKIKIENPLPMEKFNSNLQNYASVKKLSTIGELSDKIKNVKKDVRYKLAKNAVSYIASSAVSYSNVTQAQAMLKSIGTGENEINALTKAARDFSNEWAGITMPDFLSASYVIKNNIPNLAQGVTEEFTRYSLLTGIALKMNLEESSDLISKYYRRFRKEFSTDQDFAKSISNAFSATAKNFGIAGAELDLAIAEINESTSGMNVEMAEQFAVLGNAKIILGDTSKALEAYQTLLLNAEQAQFKLGLNITDTYGRMLPMSNVLDILKTHFKGISDIEIFNELKNAFSNDEVSMMLGEMIINSNEFHKSYQKLKNEISDGNTTRVMSDNMKSGKEIDLLLHRLGNLKTAIGGDLNTLTSGVTNSASSLIKMFAEGASHSWVGRDEDKLEKILKDIMREREEKHLLRLNDAYKSWPSLKDFYRSTYKKFALDLNIDEHEALKSLLDKVNNRKNVKGKFAVKFNFDEAKELEILTKEVNTAVSRNGINVPLIIRDNKNMTSLMEKIRKGSRGDGFSINADPNENRVFDRLYKEFKHSDNDSKSNKYGFTNVSSIIDFKKSPLNDSNINTYFNKEIYKSTKNDGIIKQVYAQEPLETNSKGNINVTFGNINVTACDSRIDAKQLQVEITKAVRNELSRVNWQENNRRVSDII